MFLAALVVLAVAPPIAFAAPAPPPVYVQLQQASVQGNYNSTHGIDEFLGVKYAAAQRFERAVLSTYDRQASINATAFGPACPQIKGTNSLAVDYGVYGTSEDCAYLDIYRPHDVKGKLPVMIWLHGGALTQGAASHYPGSTLVGESARIGLPVIVVSINYRLSAWGFLGGKEAAAKGALNLGLYDQKTALTWVQDYIGAFGGDKDKVTVFGQSSGAMSIGYHMLDEGTKLFRAAILESGTTTSVPALPASVYQGNYDALINLVGCGSSGDTFECLRTADMDVIYNVTNDMFGQPTVYGSRPWGVAIDGDIIPASPSVRTAQGKLARVPFITGNVADEGTIFVKPQTVATTQETLAFLERDYLDRGATFFGNLTSVATLERLYPNTPALGSPFGTGNTVFNGPQFKRAAAIYGDLHFQGPRRDFLSVAVSRDVPAWSYQFDQVSPGSADWQGVFHTGEIPYVFMGIDRADQELYALAEQVTAYWVSFAHNMDPNYHGSPKWEKYGRGKNSLRLAAQKTSIIRDDFRALGIDFLRKISDQFLEAKR